MLDRDAIKNLVSESTLLRVDGCSYTFTIDDQEEIDCEGYYYLNFDTLANGDIDESYNSIVTDTGLEVRFLDKDIKYLDVTTCKISA